jgi:hypothetical protein
MDVERALAHAQGLAREGNTQAARTRLVELVSAYPAQAEAWLLLSTLVEVDQAVDCLRRVLALNPDHERARQWLPLALAKQARQQAAQPAPAPAPAAAEAEAEMDLAEPGDEARSVPRLGQYLLDFKFVRADQLRAALAEQRRAQESGQPRRVGELLLEQGAITPERLNFAVRQQGYASL